MNFKRVLCIFLALLCVILSIPSSVFAEGKNVSDAIIDKTPMLEPDFISFSEYLTKYGEENVIVGFNQADARYEAEILGVESTLTDSVSRSQSDLFDALASGVFLNLEVIGVSDLPPGDPGFLVQLNHEGRPSLPSVVDSDVDLSHKIGEMGTRTPFSTPSVTELTSPRSRVHWRASSGDTPQAIANAYGEWDSGGYFYKFAYAFENNYYAETTATFNNTQIKGTSTQSMNAYIYLGAQSGSGTVEIGLMAAPNDSIRRQGLYVYYFFGGMFVESTPRVPGTYNSSTNTITVSNGSARIILSIGQSSGVGISEFNVSYNGNAPFYKIISTPGISCNQGSTSNPALSFIHCMSYISPTAGGVNMNSGASFTNVTFGNFRLVSVDRGERSFHTNSVATRFVYVQNPRKTASPPLPGITFTPNGNTSETVSINYHN